MELIKMSPMKGMASGAKFCALVSTGGRQMTGFGVTEAEAQADAEKKLTRKKK
jgi:hypothetical protein